MSHRGIFLPSILAPSPPELSALDSELLSLQVEIPPARRKYPIFYFYLSCPSARLLRLSYRSSFSPDPTGFSCEQEVDLSAVKAARLPLQREDSFQIAHRGILYEILAPSSETEPIQILSASLLPKIDDLFYLLAKETGEGAKLTIDPDFPPSWHHFFLCPSQETPRNYGLFLQKKERERGLLRKIELERKNFDARKTRCRWNRGPRGELLRISENKITLATADFQEVNNFEIEGVVKFLFFGPDGKVVLFSETGQNSTKIIVFSPDLGQILFSETEETLGSDWEPLGVLPRGILYRSGKTYVYRPFGDYLLFGYSAN